MRVLIILNKGPSERCLVHLHNEALVAEIRSLVNNGKYARAIMTALAKGRFEREIMHDEVSNLDAGLILSEKSASWDLM